MKWLKTLLVGRARDLSDAGLFQSVSLIAVLAWVGLGADGLSSSCYGPEEAFKALGGHSSLAIFVGLATVVTIAVICASYSQIIELFPGGGGGYLVASKLLSPKVGVVSGCALLVDYVLTIALSIASGSDALFSILPAHWHPWKLLFAVVGVSLLTVLNLRGIKEPIMLLVPVFVLFLVTHGFGILFAIGSHARFLPDMAATVSSDLHAARTELGLLGLFMLLVRAYSVGAGTYTGIEAVSNGLPVLREPRAETGKRTMLYMGTSLALVVGGLIVSYVLFRVEPQAGKTLNAVLFERITDGWPAGIGRNFVAAAMISAMALLFVGAQAGFIGGPRVLANLAVDRWFPSRLAHLSDRLVVQNGILLMGGAALVVVVLAHGSVSLLVVLYSINVFITFTLAQLGMVRHWWSCRGGSAGWKRRIAVNGVGLVMTSFILVTLCLAKFLEGGWVTLVVTGAFVATATLIRRHYNWAVRKLARLEEMVRVFEADGVRQAGQAIGKPAPEFDPEGKTAAVFVSGFNGLGVHTLLNITRMFPGVFRNYVFVQIGVVDAGNFKGAADMAELRRGTAKAADRYADYMRANGCYAEVITDIGPDIVETAGDLVDRVVARFPRTVFFGGQILFLEESWMTKLLHNFVIFALQRLVFRKGFPFVIVPVRV